MENANQLARRFREVILDGKWIANTNFKQHLSNTTWKEATKKVGTLNTIAALTFHINYYIDGVLNVFKGGDLEIRDKFSFDAPPIESKVDWDNLCQSLFDNAQVFSDYVEKLSPTELEEAFVDIKYGSYRRNIEGMIEHSYYHLGQISLLKKMI